MASVALVESVLQKLSDEGMLDFVGGIYKNAQIDIDTIAALIEDKIYDLLLGAEFTPDAPYNIYDELDIKTFKEHFDMSRKYLVAYLDYLDNFEDVKKEGNRRVLV